MASKIYTVEEALEQIKAKTKEDKISVNRFNKKNFNILMTAIANDPTFTAKMVKTRKGEIESVEEILVTDGFRKWCQKLLEQAGIDKSESGRVLTPDFCIQSMDGLYEFFTSAVYTYMTAGNQFDFMPTEEFKGSLYVKDVKEKVTVAEAKNPRDHVSLGMFKSTEKAHKKLGAKSSCPAFLKHREQVFD